MVVATGVLDPASPCFTTQCPGILHLDATRILYAATLTGEVSIGPAVAPWDDGFTVWGLAASVMPAGVSIPSAASFDAAGFIISRSALGIDEAARFMIEVAAGAAVATWYDGEASG